MIITPENIVLAFWLGLMIIAVVYLCYGDNDDHGQA